MFPRFSCGDRRWPVASTNLQHPPTVTILTIPKRSPADLPFKIMERCETNLKKYMGTVIMHWFMWASWELVPSVLSLKYSTRCNFYDGIAKTKYLEWTKCSFGFGGMCYRDDVKTKGFQPQVSRGSKFSKCLRTRKGNRRWFDLNRRQAAAIQQKIASCHSHLSKKTKNLQNCCFSYVFVNCYWIMTDWCICEDFL